MKPIIYNDIVASVDNMIARRLGNRLLLSTNLGLTYSKELDISVVGDVKLLYLFDGGELLIGDHKKIYYSHDWTSLQESQILDIDGNVFNADRQNHYSMWKGNQNRQYVDGVEILCWGNYANDAGVAFDNINVWYTKDKGATIKSCFKFGVSEISGEVMRSRHVHNVDFNPADSTFWIQTGDHGDDPKVIKATYDLSMDEWEFTLMGQGMDFKLTNMEFVGDDVYMSWDTFPGGVKKCLYSEFSDVSKHEWILSTSKDCNYVIANERGELLAFLTNYGGSGIPRYLYYSDDFGENFHKIEGDIPEMLDSPNAYYIPVWHPNNEGKILGRIRNYDFPLNEGDEPGVWIDEMIRNAGFPDAFKPLD